MSNQYFHVFTLTPWDGLKSDQLTQVTLLSLKSVFNSFPVIEKNFFDDLVSNAYKQSHYTWNLTIKRIIGPNNEDYDISSFSFIWAIDIEGRSFQFLFQKTESTKNISQGVLVALAPPELAKLFAVHEKKAIVKTLSLLNAPNRIKFLMILGPKGKSLVEEKQVFQFEKSKKDLLMDSLKKMPNIKGQWFPTANLRCSKCNYEVKALKNYSIVGLGNIICPRCGSNKLRNV
ncbi:MAG: hypothetical protein JW891_06935 [Candidatus Lokiarchaeota archaeon]|nr:hypothetical protein [Candidatus Lokiarchaeota archaeon]